MIRAEHGRADVAAGAARARLGAELSVHRTMFRIYRASPQYGLALTTFQMMLVWWLVLSGLGGWLIGWLAVRFAGAPLAIGAIVGIVAALGCFRLLRRWRLNVLV